MTDEKAEPPRNLPWPEPEPHLLIWETFRGKDKDKETEMDKHTAKHGYWVEVSVSGAYCVMIYAANHREAEQAALEEMRDHLDSSHVHVNQVTSELEDEDDE